MSRQRWVVPLALAAGVTVVTLLLVEALLHVVDYPPATSGTEGLPVEYDSLRGWRDRPNASGYFTTDEYRVRLEFNARGLRGRERPYAKPPGSYRIVFLGDSFLEGYSVALQDRVSETLERALNDGSRMRRVECIALGTSGYSTDQELLWLESEGLRYEPDLVVLLFYENDVWYNAQATYWPRAKPRFLLEGDSLRLTNVPVPRVDSAPRESVSNGRPLVDWVRGSSKIYRLVVRVAKENPRLYGLAIRAGLAHTPPEMVLEGQDDAPVPEEFQIFRRPPPADVALAWRVTDALVARMRRDVERLGARFVVFHVPFIATVYPSGPVRNRYGLAGSDFEPDAVVQRLRKTCVQEGITCLEPTARFRAVADSLNRIGGRLYYRYDWHWNADGHRLAARVLEEYIRASGALAR